MMGWVAIFIFLILLALVVQLALWALWAVAGLTLLFLAVIVGLSLPAYYIGVLWMTGEICYRLLALRLPRRSMGAWLSGGITSSIGVHLVLLWALPSGWKGELAKIAVYPLNVGLWSIERVISDWFIGGGRASSVWPAWGFHRYFDVELPRAIGEPTMTIALVVAPLVLVLAASVAYLGARRFSC